MTSLRIGFVDTFDNCANYFTYLIGQRHNVIRDDINPQILFFSDWFFGNRRLQYDSKKTVRIFFTGENTRPDWFSTDYAITFDHVNSPFHYRLPLYVLEMWAHGIGSDFPISREPKLSGITYVQSNPNCEQRNAFVTQVIYKSEKVGNLPKLFAAGPHMNNVGFTLPREPRKTKLDFLRKYKFNIAFENGSHPGYVTEKLLDAFAGSTIPIYWGSPTVDRDFNPEAFIYCKGTENWYNVFDEINRLDKDDNAYYEMLNKPKFIDNRPNENMYESNFHAWFNQLLERENLNG